MSLEEGPFVFRVNENGTGPNLLIQVCMERGWREYTENSALRDNWNLWWKTSAFPVGQHKQLKAWQFTNHIPKGASICRKDNLARYLKCMKKVYGAVYDISPYGYNLPLEYTKLVADCSRHRDDEENQKVWICKPVGQSQGRGIFLFKSLSDLCYDSNAVVQRYIKNPLLIGGYKFDLRLYVCVPSYHPLTVYLYKEGLVRFSTDKFSLSDLNNPFCHLTNSSLNKLGPGYSEQKDRIGAGCKWNLRQLRHYFQQAGIRDWLLWQRISALVTLTVLSQSPSVPQTTNCFEFYGFDVLVDDKLKPWLLEVNLSPALGFDCDVDPVVKKPLLHDLFDLLGLPVCNTGLSLFTIYSPLELLAAGESPIQSDNEDGECCQVRHRLRTAIHSVAAAAAAQQTASGSRGAANQRCTTAAIKPPNTASSAIMVATAATKWRRKRKTSYLFGPPKKNNYETDKPKVDNKNTNTQRTSPQTLNPIELGRLKSQKTEEKKKQEEVVEHKTGRKSAVNMRRSRQEPVEKLGLKSCVSTVEMSQKSKGKLPPASNTSKTMLCLDSISKNKKMEGELQGEEGVRKLKPIMGGGKRQGDSHVRTNIIPFDKGCAGNRGFKGRNKQQPPLLWGNGRDWRTPVNHEGDWGRVYPLHYQGGPAYQPEFEEDFAGNKFSVGDKQIPLVVHHVTKFMKTAKQVFTAEENISEEEMNKQLMTQLGLTADIWLPSK